MEANEETPFSNHSGSQSLFPDSASDWSPAWSYLHKAIIVIVMGSLMSAAGGLLFLLRSSGQTEASHSMASACLSIGLIFVVLGLVWIPVLKEKQRRKQWSQGVWPENVNKPMATLSSCNSQ